MGIWHEHPLPDAYQRVTDPERFRPLHAATLALVAGLEREFDVLREEGYGLDAGLEGRAALARPSIRLTPRQPRAAPVTLVFTAFPGVLARTGRWREEAFPACGCDACAASASPELDRLRILLDDVAAGRFREEVRTRLLGGGELRWQGRTLEGAAYGGRRSLTRARAWELAGGRRRLTLAWRPWPLRPPGA
jgi:hypothetical protein